MKKILYIIGPQGPKWQGTYYDKINVNVKTPWLTNIPKKYYIDDNGKITNENEKYVRIDVAVYYYLKSKIRNPKQLKKIEIQNITESTFENYDLVINQFMDLLIVPFVNKFEKNGKPHERLRQIYEKYANKIYPPIEYANLIYDKCLYYEYLKNNKITIAPTYCYDLKTNLSNENLLSKNWKEIFAKPVYGTNSVNTQLLKGPNIMNGIKDYITYIKSKEKYPKIIFQKFMKNFEVKYPQIRMYYIGNKLQYCIGNYKDGTTFKYKNIIVKQKLNKISQKILSKISKDFFGKYYGIMLITRIDFGYSNGIYFVNELEFNPGLYLHMDKNKFNMDVKIGKQLNKILKNFIR